MTAAVDGVPATESAFPMVMRGYDRPQVDEYIARISTMTQQSRAGLADVEQRLREIEHKGQQAERALDAAERTLAGGPNAGPSLSGLCQMGKSEKRCRVIWLGSTRWRSAPMASFWRSVVEHPANPAECGFSIGKHANEQWNLATSRMLSPVWPSVPRAPGWRL